MPGETNLTLRIPNSLKLRLKAEMERDSRSMSQITVMALNKYLQEKEKTK